MKPIFPDNPTPIDRPDKYYLLIHQDTHSIVASAIMSDPDADRINRLATFRFKTFVWIRQDSLPNGLQWQTQTYCPKDLLQQLSSRK